MNGHSQEFLDSMWHDEKQHEWYEAIRRAVVEDYLTWLNDPVAQNEYQEWSDARKEV